MAAGYHGYQQLYPFLFRHIIYLAASEHLPHGAASQDVVFGETPLTNYIVSFGSSSVDIAFVAKARAQARAAAGSLQEHAGNTVEKEHREKDNDIQDTSWKATPNANAVPFHAPPAGLPPSYLPYGYPPQSSVPATSIPLSKPSIANSSRPSIANVPDQLTSPITTHPTVPTPPESSSAHGAHFPTDETSYKAPAPLAVKPVPQNVSPPSETIIHQPLDFEQKRQDFAKQPVQEICNDVPAAPLDEPSVPAPNKMVSQGGFVDGGFIRPEECEKLETREDVKQKEEEEEEGPVVRRQRW